MNNAGISTRALAVQSDFEGVDLRVNKINYLGQVAVTKSILGEMIKQRSGLKIIFFSFESFFWLKRFF